MAHRRGDDIPSVSDYDHWGEEAAAVWYEENKYDMMYADEIVDNEGDFDNYDDPDE